MRKGHFSGVVFLECLTPNFQLISIVLATLRTYDYPPYILATEINIMHHQLITMPCPSRKYWEIVQSLKVIAKQFNIESWLIPPHATSIAHGIEEPTHPSK